MTELSRQRCRGTYDVHSKNNQSDDQTTLGLVSNRNFTDFSILDQWID